MKTIKVFAVILTLNLMGLSAFSQGGVAINADGSDPDASAMLDIQSTSLGLLVPRMTWAERNLIPSPATGLLIFQTDNTPGYYYFNGTSWGVTGSIGGTGTTSTYGELYEENATYIPIIAASAGTYYGWVNASIGNLNKVTFIPDGTANQLVVSEAGTYLVHLSLFFGIKNNNVTIDGAIFHNGIIQNDLKLRSELSAGDIGSASITGIITLSVDDYLDLRFTSSKANDEIRINLCNLNIVRIM